MHFNSASVLKLLSKLLNSSSELENFQIYNSTHHSTHLLRGEYRRKKGKEKYPIHRTISPSFPKASTRSCMPRSHAAPFDPLIAQRTMIAKTESSVFLTGRPAKPAFNSRNFSFTCHTHSVFGDSSPGIVPLKRLCLTLRCFPTIHAHVQHVHARAYKGVEARHRHTDTDVEWRVAHEKVDEGIFSEQTLQDRLSIAGLSRIHATSSRRLFLWTYTVLGHVFSTLHLT